MIEKALRDQLRPMVRKRIRLYLAKYLAVSWLVCAGVGLVLLGLHWIMGWNTTPSFWLLTTVALGMTLWVVNRSGKIIPDYQAVARTIEQQHPEIKSLLLAALEQTPYRSGEPLGYLQKRVIHEALTHAMSHDWMQSIPRRTLIRADIGRYSALLLLGVVLSQLFPSFSILPAGPEKVFKPRETKLTVSPGDSSVEIGSPVVIMARFAGIIPSEADLVTIGTDQAATRVRLNKSLDDPVFGTTLPSVESDLKYYIEYNDQRSSDFTIRVFTHPALEQADARIVPPVYTQLSEKVILDTQRISVAEGSQVTLTFTLNKPVATARLEARSGQAPPLIMDGNYPNIYTASLTATTSQRYELHLADDQGRANKVAPRFVMEVLENRPPDLKAVFPGRDVEVSPLEELTLEADVSDDYGLIDYGLTYGLAGSEEQTLSLSGSTDANLSAAPSDSAAQAGQMRHTQTVLTLEEMKARPDQLLIYYYWADDIGPDGHPRRTTSDIYFAEVRPFEEVFRESESSGNQDQQAQQGQGGQQAGAEELVRLQKQIITATWNVKQRTELNSDANEVTEDLNVISDSQSEALAMAGAALSQADNPEAAGPLQAAEGFMESALDHLASAAKSTASDDLVPALGAEQSAYQELLKLRERDYQISQSRNGNRAANSNSARFNQQLQQLELRQQEDRYESQRMAQNQNEPQQRENLQVLNRLRDLARRQEEMADRLREAQAALQQAQNEEERQEALRQLKRLRDEQQQALDDVDELQQRMNRPENRQRMAETQQQLDRTRSRIQQSTEELEEGMLSRAVTSTTRSQRELDQMREDFQRGISSQFEQDMRTLRQQAQSLDQQQRKIAEQMREQMESRQKSLTDRGETDQIAERLAEQQDRTEQLINRMRDISEASETSEPLLSRKLYDTLRNVGTDNLDQALEATEELVRRNFLPEAQRIERRASQDIRTLREGVEDAARGILGDPEEALQQAREQLDNLIQEVDEEARRVAEEETLADRDPNREMQPGRIARSEMSESSQEPWAQNQGTRTSSQLPQPGQSTGQDGIPTESELQPSDTQQARGGGGDGQQDEREGRNTQLAEDAQQGDPLGWGGGRPQSSDFPEAWTGGGRQIGPLTGEDYTQWSDRLRDVEEMLEDPALRNEAARVRDRARAMRAEFIRHGTEPQWDLVRQDIMKPLVELRKQVLDMLAQIQSDDALVPIDRDPVPGRYADRVRRYFETLGETQ